MWLQTEIEELGMLGVVIMLFCFDARVGKVVNLDFHAQIFSRFLHFLRDIEDGKLFGELVVDPALALSSGIQASQFDAAHRVANIQEAAGLTSLSINGQWLADGRL